MDTKKKRRMTFATLPDARAWRLEQLRRMYGSSERSGKADTAYGLLRRTAQELDRAIPSSPENLKPLLRESLARLYEAEDVLLTALTRMQ